MRLFIASLLIILICTFSVVADAQAAPDHMTISGKDWMVANGMDDSTITVTVYDVAGNPLPGYHGNVQRVCALDLFGDERGHGFLRQDNHRPPADHEERRRPYHRRCIGCRSRCPSLNRAELLRGISSHSTPQTAVPTYDLNVSVGTTTLIQVKVTDAFREPCGRPESWSRRSSSQPPGIHRFRFLGWRELCEDPDGSRRLRWVCPCDLPRYQVGTNFVDIQPPAPILHRAGYHHRSQRRLPLCDHPAISPAAIPTPIPRRTGASSGWGTLLDQLETPPRHGAYG